MNILISVETFESIAASVLEAIRPITEWSYQGTPQYYADDISFFAYDSRLDDAELSTEADSLAIYFDTAGVKESVVDRIYSAIVDEFSRRGICLTRSGDIDGGSSGLVYSIGVIRPEPESPKDFIDWVRGRYGLRNKTASVKKAAELLKVEEITVWQWLKGVRRPSPSMLLLMKLVFSHSQNGKSCPIKSDN